jgi:hypothetical protein
MTACHLWTHTLEAPNNNAIPSPPLSLWESIS